MRTAMIGALAARMLGILSWSDGVLDLVGGKGATGRTIRTSIVVITFLTLLPAGMIPTNVRSEVPQDRGGFPEIEG